MRVRLTRYEHLRIALEPGWLELPSHLPAPERRRLLDLLGAALPDIDDIVECRWDELRFIDVGPRSLVLVSLPDDPSFGERLAKLHGLAARHGLYIVEAPGRWPERAWDELEVKSRLATWLRRSLRRPEHPLAPLGVAELPLARLVAATSEPVELLELVELAVEIGVEQRRASATVDWARCVTASIGRRLVERLSGAAPALRAAIVHSLAAGELSALTDRRVLDELARLGLIFRAEGDVALVPLARQAAEPEVMELLERPGT
jgi:hypothetical protein